MKRFHFPLDRVLDYRQAQVRIEEAKLERLHAELYAIKAREAALAAERDQARSALVAAASASGEEFAALEHYRRAAARQLARFEQQRLECNQRIAGQMQALARRRREARLLEKLRERRLGEWKYAFAREIEQQAGEAFLARWNTTQ